MKTLSLFISRLFSLLLIVAGSIWVQSCSAKISVKPAFSADSGILLTKVESFETEPSGMTGDKQTFVFFITKSDQKTLEKATSGTDVSTGLTWRNGQTDELKKILHYFEAYETYQKLYPRIHGMLDAADLRYACAELYISNRGVEYASVWVCSPSRHEVAYLSGF